MSGPTGGATAEPGLRAHSFQGPGLPAYGRKRRNRYQTCCRGSGQSASISIRRAGRNTGLAVRVAAASSGVRPDSPWIFSTQDADPSLSSDDIDNIETSVAAPPDLVDWLARFIAPDAVIFHESLGGNRPPELIRLLRDAVGKSLSASNGNAIIRMQAFKELPSFGNDKLTVVAIDDLPCAPGIDFGEKVLQRFNQFDYRIKNILDQKPTGADDPAILRVAMLVQGAAAFRSQRLTGLEPLSYRAGQHDTVPG